MNIFVKEFRRPNCLIYRMKRLVSLCLLLLAGAWTAQAGAQLQLAVSGEPQKIFSGHARNISVAFSNPARNDFAGEVRVRVYQASSATTFLFSDTPWKNIAVPAGETVLETAALDFPQVNAKTKFLVQWLENTDGVIGITGVLVYPTNLFQILPPFDKNDLGVFDPNNQLKPLLRALGIHFQDLGGMSLTNFSGKLAMIGPFESRAQEPDGLAQWILTIAKNNVATVWMQPPRGENAPLQPSFFSVPKGRAAVIVTQADLISDLADNPQSQLNLIHFCDLALHPQPATLPDLALKP
jgi:hypothetical protein